MSPSSRIVSDNADEITKRDSRMRQGEEMETSYGFKNISKGEKQPLVNDVFRKVASRYDLMNDLMSAGLHRQWKNMMTSALVPPLSGTLDWHCLDVAGGTGDIALRVAKASREQARVTVLDINASMLEEGKKKARIHGLYKKIDFIRGNAEELPFTDRCFSAYTIAFGIRNVPDINKALREAFRVLKPGGRFLCLEFSRVETSVLNHFYNHWSMRVIPKIGKWVTGDDSPYQYLVESIRKFPDQGAFSVMIGQAGFEKITTRNYTGGIVALHSGWKI